MSEALLPLVIIGAGPVGLAAAAHALRSNLTPLLIEAGSAVGAGILRWGHVQLFSPWRLNVDLEAARLLTAEGWNAPAEDERPTGHELVQMYLEPLSRTKPYEGRIKLRTRVVAVARRDHDLRRDADREQVPFLVRTNGPLGEQDLWASAVIDASGTIENPRPLGASGIPAIGECALNEHIFYGIPDILGTLSHRYAGRRVLVVGSGHSALNVLLDLARLAEADNRTQVTWAIRGQSATEVLATVPTDPIADRRRLGSSVRGLLDSGWITLIQEVGIDRVTKTAEGVIARSGGRSLPAVDEIIAATGYHPDWSMLSEVRLDLHPSLESPRGLAALIDPARHTCGTVQRHGANELKHPESNFFVVGMKSYGRAPTFLLHTGYDQVRSVVAALAGKPDLLSLPGLDGDSGNSQCSSSPCGTLDSTGAGTLCPPDSYGPNDREPERWQ